MSQISACAIPSLLSLVGDFGTALQEVLDTYSPDRIIIEPSGVGKLSDVSKAVSGVMEKNEDVKMNGYVSFLINVVLPAPKKPEKMSILVIAFLHFQAPSLDFLITFY